MAPGAGLFVLFETGLGPAAADAAQQLPSPAHGCRVAHRPTVVAPDSLKPDSNRLEVPPQHDIEGFWPVKASCIVETADQLFVDPDPQAHRATDRNRRILGVHAERRASANEPKRLELRELRFRIGIEGRERKLLIFRLPALLKPFPLSVGELESGETLRVESRLRQTLLCRRSAFLDPLGLFPREVIVGVVFGRS